MFDSSMVNESSGFEPLKFYCIDIRIVKQQRHRSASEGLQTDLGLPNSNQRNILNVSFPL